MEQENLQEKIKFNEELQKEDSTSMPVQQTANDANTNEDMATNGLDIQSNNIIWVFIYPFPFLYRLSYLRF